MPTGPTTTGVEITEGTTKVREEWVLELDIEVENVV